MTFNGIKSQDVEKEYSFIKFCDVYCSESNQEECEKACNALYAEPIPGNETRYKVCYQDDCFATTTTPYKLMRLKPENFALPIQKLPCAGVLNCILR